MSHAVGDTVWVATTFVEFDGRVRMHASPNTVAAIVEGATMIRSSLGSIRQAERGSETLCDSEAEAWAVAARELTAARDRIQAAIDEATAKAAGSRVGEAVPA